MRVRPTFVWSVPALKLAHVEVFEAVAIERLLPIRRELFPVTWVRDKSSDRDDLGVFVSAAFVKVGRIENCHKSLLDRGTQRERGAARLATSPPMIFRL